MEDEQLARMWKEAWEQYTSITGNHDEDLPSHVNAESLVKALDRQYTACQNWTQENVRGYVTAPLT